MQRNVRLVMVYCVVLTIVDLWQHTLETIPRRLIRLTIVVTIPQILTV